MSDWRPIETAPRDGTWVLVLGDRYKNTDRPAVAPSRWIAETTERWEYVSDTRQELRTEDSSHWDYDAEVYAPTHWMPLPEMPK